MQELGRFCGTEAEVINPDLSQFATHPQAREGEAGITAAGHDEGHRGRHVIEEKGDPLVDF